MSAQTGLSTTDREPTPAEFAEAAAWIARLHGPDRTLRVEQGLRRWLNADAAHVEAFEAMTAAWEVTGRLPRKPFPRLSRWQRAGYRDGFIRSAVAVASVAMLILASLFYAQYNDGVATGVGEQRTLVLEDGTRVTLNTKTRIKVDYSAERRAVELRSGEALFEVARRPDWPFVVEAGDRQVRALGTAFVVRREGNELEITLVEGKVAVAPLDLPELARLPAPSFDTSQVQEPAAGAPAAPAITYMVPGQRLTIAADHPPRLDQPAIEKVTAWRRGLVDFESTPLAAAAAEMNRYSVHKLIVEDPQVAGIPITGVFRSGDVSSLAAAVSRAYQLEVVQSGDAYIVTGARQPSTID